MNIKKNWLIVESWYPTAALGIKGYQHLSVMHKINATFRHIHMCVYTYTHRHFAQCLRFLLLDTKPGNWPFSLPCIHLFYKVQTFWGPTLTSRMPFFTRPSRENNFKTKIRLKPIKPEHNRSIVSTRHISPLCVCSIPTVQWRGNSN